MKGCKKWHRGLVFRQTENLPPASAGENPKKSPGNPRKYIDQRRGLNVEEGLQVEADFEAQDAVDNIAGVRKNIDKKRDAYFAVVRKMYYEGVKAKAGDVTMAEYTEKVALAFKDLVASYQDVIKIQEEAKHPDFVRKLAGDLLKIEVPLIQTKKVEETRRKSVDLMDLTNPLDPEAMKKATHKTEVYKTYYKTEVVKQTFEIPKTSREYMVLQNGAEIAVIGARANLFLLTGDGKYEKDYKQDSQQRNKNFATNGLMAIEKAKQADSKGLSGAHKLMLNQDNEEKYNQVEEYIGRMARKQLEIEQMRMSDPVKAFGLANQLYKILNNLQKDMGNSPLERQDAGLPTEVLFSISEDGHLRKQMDAKFFQELKKSSPKVFQRFSQLVDIGHKKTSGLAREIIGKDPEILQFQRELSGFVKSGEGLFKTFYSLMQDMQRGETPSKPYMAKIHEDLDRYINSPYFKDIKKNWPRQKYLSYLNQDLSAVPGAKKMIESWEKAYNALDEYRAKILQVNEELKDIGGDNVGVIGMLKELGKFALLIGACVATGGAMTAIGAGMFTTISTISAVSTLGNASLDYLDGNKGAFDPGALIEGYAQSMAVSALSGVVSKPIGTLWGNFAKRMNDRMAKSDIGWLRKFAERGYAANLMQGEGKSFVKRFISELGEETLEEGMLRFGQAIAPKDPLIGFMFQFLGTSARVARGVFHKGKFQIRNSLRGEVTDTGVKLEYVNIEEVSTFLHERGLDAEAIGKLIKDGGLVIEKDGVKLEVVGLDKEVFNTGLSLTDVARFQKQNFLEINDEPEIVSAVKQRIVQLRKILGYTGESLFDKKLNIRQTLTEKGLMIEYGSDTRLWHVFSDLKIKLPSFAYDATGDFKILVDGIEIDVRNVDWPHPYYGKLKIQEKYLRERAKKFPMDVLGKADLYKDKPYANEIIKDALYQMLNTKERMHHIYYLRQLLFYFPIFKDQSYAEDLLTKVAESLDKYITEENPHGDYDLGAIFAYANILLSVPVFESILLKHAQANTNLALRYLSRYVDNAFAETIVKTVMEKNLSATLFNVDKYKNQTWAAEMINQVAEKYPLLVLDNVSKYIDQSWADEVIVKAATAILDKAGDSAGSIFRSIKFFKNKDFVKKIVFKAVDKDSQSALLHFRDYKDQDYAEDILLHTAKKSPELVFSYSNNFIEAPFSERILREALGLIRDENIHTVFMTFKIFKNKRYAEELLRIAANRPIRGPQNALNCFDEYQDQPYALSIFKKAFLDFLMIDPNQTIRSLTDKNIAVFSGEELVKVVQDVIAVKPLALWSGRFLLPFTPEQAEILHKTVIRNGSVEMVEELIGDFLSGEKRLPVDEVTAGLGVESLIYKNGKIVRDTENANEYTAAYEKKLQDFITGHVDKIIEDRKNDPQKAATTILQLYKKNYPKNYLKEARELIVELRGKERAGLVRDLYRIVYDIYTGAFEEKVFGKFMDIAESVGETKAAEYIAGLNEKAKGLIGSEIPADLRASEEYMYYVKYVYPEGNYSNHEKNLGMGDATAHLDGYKYEKGGYATTLTGLLGYEFKDVRAEADVEGQPSIFRNEHLALMARYQERLSKVRDFVASRGPNNGELQKTFEAKIDGFFETKAAQEYKELKNLSAREKMLVLFVSEAVRKGQSGRGFTPDAEILDLIVEYKYAYHENLEEYVQRSADTVKRGRDEATQHYFLWSELSTIYGENLKHILRHDIFEGMQSEENYHRIVEIFTRQITPAEEQDLKPKQWENFANTFSNPHITPDKRYDIIRKQISGFVASNIKFKSDSEKAQFGEELEAICQKLKAKGDFTLEDFKAIVPELFALRNRYRFDINTKIDELFASDINTILAEIAKYEPKIEEEAKETRMGGEKHKEVRKSAKPRKIRSFFMKTKESANARMGAYLCISGDGGMWENKNYFEMVMKNEENGKAVGVAMLLNIEAKDGKKYLWFGPNPYESFLEQVSSKQTYDYMLKIVSDFAAENGYDGVVVPSQDSQILGGCTNRGGDFPDIIKASRLRDDKGGLKIVKFGGSHKLGLSYSYEDGALIWEKQKKSSSR